MTDEFEVLFPDRFPDTERLWRVWQKGDDPSLCLEDIPAFSADEAAQSYCEELDPEEVSSSLTLCVQVMGSDDIKEVRCSQRVVWDVEGG